MCAARSDHALANSTVPVPLPTPFVTLQNRLLDLEHASLWPGSIRRQPRVHGAERTGAHRLHCGSGSSDLCLPGLRTPLKEGAMFACPRGGCGEQSRSVLVLMTSKPLQHSIEQTLWSAEV